MSNQQQPQQQRLLSRSISATIRTFMGASMVAGATLFITKNPYRALHHGRQAAVVLGIINAACVLSE